MSYNDNGDMVTEAGQVFRQIGWQINGGEFDGQIVTEDERLAEKLRSPHGSYSPVYVEVGKD